MFVKRIVPSSSSGILFIAPTTAYVYRVVSCRVILQHQRHVASVTSENRNSC
jgi:hypothetical protein